MTCICGATIPEPTQAERKEALDDHGETPYGFSQILDGVVHKTCEHCGWTSSIRVPRPFEVRRNL